jgi:beta-phosphoglucomutase
MIKAAVFDMDGVLVDNMHTHFLAWKEFFTGYGVSISEQDFKTKLSGRTSVDTVRLLLGDKVREEDIDMLVRKKETRYRDIVAKSLTPVGGAVEFVRALKREGFMVAVATSADKNGFEFTIGRLGIMDCIDAVAKAEDITHPKPHPEVFLKAAEKLGVRPAECVVFEDSHSGVAAAKAAGMKVVLVMTSHPQEEFDNINKAIKDFTDMKPVDILKIR